jgi:hypothetical protein
MRLKIAIVGLALALFGCANSESTALLETQRKEVDAEIASAKSALLKYGEGSPLHLLITLRLSVYEQTKAMLDQKIAAVRWYPKFTYTVDGKEYVPPGDVAARIEQLEIMFRTAKADYEATARSAGGGLLGILKTMQAEITGLQVAQLQYQLTAYRAGFPPYLPHIPLPEGAGTR